MLATAMPSYVIVLGASMASMAHRAQSVTLPAVRTRIDETVTGGATHVSTGQTAARRPKSAPSSPHAGRRLLASRGKTSNQRSTYRYGHSHSRRAKSRQRHTAYSHTSPSKMVSVLEGHGYSLKRTSSRVKMNINTLLFFGGENEGPDGQSNRLTQDGASRHLLSVPPNAASQQAIQESIELQAALQTELAEMTLQLDLMKEEHEQAMAELQDRHEAEKEHISQRHETEISKLREGHEKEVKMAIERCAEEQETQHMRMAAETAAVQEELDFMKELIESTRAELNAEAERRLKKLEEDLGHRHSREMTELEASLKSEAEQRLERVRGETESRHRRERELAEKKHQEDINALLSQFSQAAQLEEELTQYKRRHKKLEEEVSGVREALTSTQTQLLETEAKLYQTQSELNHLERDFQNKVRAVEERYRDEIDSLRRENTELRRRVIHKSEQFNSYRSQVERSQGKILKEFGERASVVAAARHTATLGPALGLEDGSTSEGRLPLPPRPLSAPTTQSEAHQARQGAREKVAATTTRLRREMEMERERKQRRKTPSKTKRGGRRTVEPAPTLRTKPVGSVVDNK